VLFIKLKRNYWVVFYLLSLGIFSASYSIENLEKTYLKNKNSLLNNPEITGPDRLCNLFGSVIGTFSGGGNSSLDLYQWTILGPAGQILRETQFRNNPDISYTFGLLGTHKIKVKVSRGGIVIYEEEKTVELVKGPDILLKAEYQICENQTLIISAIDPSSANFSSYEFEWKDESGNTIGTNNNLSVNKKGKYQVTFFFTNSSGVTECITSLETEVRELSSFSIVTSSSTVCPSGDITFETNPPTIGDWFYQKVGEPNPVPIKVGSSLVLSSGQLPGPGDYEIIVKVDNPQNPACSPEVRQVFKFNIQPEIELIQAFGASDCFVPDGKLQIKALTPIEGISIGNLGLTQGPFSAGDTIDFAGLKSGAYSISFNLNGCSNIFGTVVPLTNPPSSLEFVIEEIQPEICTDTGKDLGSFLFRMLNNPLEGSYRILNQRGVEIVNQAVSGLDKLRVEIAGGTYFFQVYGTDSCTVPKSEEFEIPGLDQVNFSIPGDLFVCQSYDLIPQTNQNLEFTLINKTTGTEETKAKDQPFTITEEGEFEIIGRLAGQGDLCPSLQEFTITLVEPVDFEPVLIQEDCDGNRTFEADIKGRDPNTINYVWYNEKNEIVGNGKFLFPTSSGEFKLDVQPNNSTACPIPPVAFMIEKPILEVDVNLSSTKLCEFGPRAVLDLTMTFEEAVTDIEWRRYDAAGNILQLNDFEGKKQIIVEESGIYEAAVFSRIPSIGKDCELGRSSLKIDLVPNKVDFEIPGNLVICDPFELLPIGSADLEYTLSYPDGSQITKLNGDQFILDQAGDYTILGYNPDVTWPLCPEQKEFTVTIKQPVLFQSALVDLSCDGTYTYRAEVSNYALSEVDFFWRNSSGALVSTDFELLSNSYGEFSLEVQPKGSLSCSDSTVPFTIPIPILEVSSQIISETLCPDQPDAALKVEANLESVQTIQWWYTDLSNNTSQLNQFTNSEEILATQEGTYEVRLINSFGCILGRASQLVIRSTDQIRPQLESSYQVCPRYEIGPTLNPGNFSSYEWYFKGNIVSTSSSFKPLEVGQYEVVVVSEEGCAYQIEFVTEEECELKLRIPTAIQPEVPDKQFLIYTNYLVDELEVWIFNKWGNLIFYCENSSLIDQESTCLWDGTYQGQKVPPGAYSYRINYKNLEKNIQKVQLGAVLILD
jgi:hypothetical protein